MKIFRFPFIICCLFLLTNAYSQKRAVDSLEVLLKTAKQDTTRIKIYLALCEICDIKDKLKYAEPAILLSDKLLIQAKDKIQNKDH